MRGVRAFRQAPLVALFVLLTTCRFEFNLIEPSIELVNAQSAYQSASNIVIDYIFTADESSLRCKYAVNNDVGTIQHGITEEFPPGTLQHLPITFEEPPAAGEYTVNLVAQARRSEGFIDLAFLTRTFEFYLDFDEPAEPKFSPAGGLFNDNAYVELSHDEWTNPLGSPVRVFYTTNPTDPDETSSQYVVGSPIFIELSETPTEIRAIAIDESGRESLISSETYSFLNIEHTTSTRYNYEQGPNKYYVGDPDQYIYPHGYGFLNIAAVEFVDGDGTPATTAVMAKTLTDMTVAVHIESGFADDGTTNEGILRVTDSTGVTDEIAVDLVPGLPPP